MTGAGPRALTKPLDIDGTGNHADAWKLENGHWVRATCGQPAPITPTTPTVTA